MINMNDAVKICLTASFAFFMAGLFAGVWKYGLMITSKNGSSRFYVDAAHRTSFFYAFSSLLLGVFACLSIFPVWINMISAVSVIIFFVSAVALNFINGLKGDCKNQILESKNNAPGYASARTVKVYMALLICAEIAGTSILGAGAVLALWDM